MELKLYYVPENIPIVYSVYDFNNRLIEGKKYNLARRIPKNLENWIENVSKLLLKIYVSGSNPRDYYSPVDELKKLRDTYKVKYIYIPFLTHNGTMNESIDILLDFNQTRNSSSDDTNGSKNSIEFLNNNIDLDWFNNYQTPDSEVDKVDGTIKIFTYGKKNIEPLKLDIIQKYLTQFSYEDEPSWSQGNLKKYSKNNAWSRYLILNFKPNSGGGYNLERAYLTMTIGNYKNSIFLANINNYITSSAYDPSQSKWGLVYQKSLGEIIDDKYLDRSELINGKEVDTDVLIAYQKKQKTSGSHKSGNPIYPSYILPLANDSNYFYYNTTPDKVVSINKWKVTISGNLTEKDPGATIQNISGDLTATPVYRYKGKINLAGNDISLSLNPVFNNYKENDPLGNIKRINNYLFEWYQDGKEGINEGDKFNLMTPSIDGWEFTGWKLADGRKINDLSSPTEWVYKKHNTITATWKPKEYTITYKLLVPIEEKGDTSGQVYQIGNSKYSEVCFVTSSDRKKVKEDSFISKYYPGQKCELNSLGLFNSLFLEGYEKLGPDTVFHVIKHDSLENTWLTEEESSRSNSWYKPGQIISSQNIKTLGDVTLALIATPHKYTLTYNKPVYLKENKEYDLVGVNYKEEGNSNFTILNSKSFLSNSDLIYNDVNDLYPISRGYKFDYNVVKGASGKDYTGIKVEPYTIFEDITVKSYFKIARYKFRYYDYYYDTYEDSDEFYYNDLSCGDGSSYLLPKFKPNNVKIIPDSEFYRFDGWSNKNLGKAFLSDIMVNVENTNYFYQKDGNTYLRIPQNSADEINIIDLKSDWTRFSGPKIYKSDGWNWPVNYQGNNEKDEDGNYYDAIKVFDEEGWHQVIKVFIRDEEKWNDLNIKSSHTTYEEI